MESKICQFCKKEYKSGGDKRNFKNSKYCNKQCFGDSIRGKFNDHKVIGSVTEIYWKDKTIIIDTEDLENVNKCRWCVTNAGYAYVKNKRDYGLLHHIIMGKPNRGMVVDHINRNTLDNRRSNLRTVTHAENLRNTGIISNNTTGYKGICFCKKEKKFKPKISVNLKTINRGSYIKIEDAVNARKEAELKYWGKNYE